MAKIAYQSPLKPNGNDRFAPWKMHMIGQADGILNEYKKRGLPITLRGLYYQFVARDLFPETWQDEATGSTNNERSYKKLIDVMGDGRMTGLIDWDSITDETRALSGSSTYEGLNEFSIYPQYWYKLDKWLNQPTRVEVWIEKDAVKAIASQACTPYQVSYFSCRGNVSASEMHVAAMRIKGFIEKGQRVVILHLGDHDPSGVDMTRDIYDRISGFLGHLADRFTVERIALTMAQIKQYKPPRNPAKITDSRYDAYVERFSTKYSWELDALDPQLMKDLIQEKIKNHRDETLWDAIKETEKGHKAILESLNGRWDEVEALLSDKASAPYDPTEPMFAEIEKVISKRAGQAHYDDFLQELEQVREHVVDNQYVDEDEYYQNSPDNPYAEDDDSDDDDDE